MTANISLDELKTPEIESPEELIKKLEENSKKILAEKLKGVLAWINGTTEEKWQKLKAELSIDEEKEIRETLKNKETKIESILNEWVIPTNVTDAKAIASTLATKEWMNKVVEEWKKWFWESMKNMFAGLFEFLWKIPFIGGFFAAIWKMFGFGKVAEAIEVAWESINKIDKEKVTNEVKNVIKTSNIPVDEKTLNTTISNMTEDDLKTLNEKIQKWEKITIEDLKNLESTKTIFSKDNIKEWLSKEAEKAKVKLIDNIKREIEAKYQITLTPDKVKKLEELVKNDLKINDATLETVYKAQEEKRISTSDILKAAKDNWIDTFWFSIKLITSWIIPASAIWLDFAKSWAEIASNAVELSVWALWIKEHVNVDTFQKSIENLNPDEKALLLALLYRKWWLFLSIVWSALAITSRMAIEWVTNTSVKSWEAYKSSITKDFSKQASQFEKIASSLWQAKWETKDAMNILESAKSNLEIVRKNYLSLEILRKHSDNVDEAIKELQSHSIEVKWNPKNIDELKKALSTNFNQVFNEKISKWNFYNKFWFWAKADLYELNQKLENIAKYQKAVFDWNLWWKALYKTRELLQIPQVSRLWDRLAFHFNSVDEVKSFWRRMSVMFQQSPELIKWIFDKLPIFVVAWIAANSDKPFFQEIQKEFLYLFPIIWPVLLLWESWLNWKDWLKVENALEAWIWWTLLAIDWVFLTKELMTNWAWWAWRYLVKPVTDIYSMWKWTAKFWYESYKLAQAAKYSDIFKNAVEKTKALKWRTRAVVLAGLIVWWWVSYAFAWDNSEMKEFVWKDWNIDNEKLKKEVANMSIWEKEELIKLLFHIEMWEKLTKNIDFNIKDSKLVIDSKNKEVKSAFIINDEILEKMSILWLKSYKFNYYWQS